MCEVESAICEIELVPVCQAASGEVCKPELVRVSLENVVFKLDPLVVGSVLQVIDSLFWGCDLAPMGQGQKKKGSAL